jgi:hypothetical protein
MKLILIAALLISFGNDPATILSLDEDHSIGLLREHGVDHLVFFHRASDSETCPGTYFTRPTGGNHHEVHLSSSTGLIHKKLHGSSFPTAISPTTDHMHSVKLVSTDSDRTFELDIGEPQSPLQVLRI